MKKLKIIILLALVVLTASIGICGHDKDNKSAPKTKTNLYDQVELFADAISILRSDYVEEVDSQKLIYGAMKGMLSSLDDYSQFLEPEEFNEMKVETKGEFGGIGVEVSMRDGVLTVIAPIAGTPAESSGVEAGDKIVKLDGVTTKDISLHDAVKKMRGKPGTELIMTVWRDKDEKILDIKIKRAIIKVKSIKKCEFIDGKIGYIKLVEFQENTARDLEEALKKLESQGMTALILDLRNNPGGLLDGAVDVCEKFLVKDKAIVSVKGRTGGQNMEFKSSGKYPHPDYPMIVMANEGSASASEIVAGAIQDNKRGIVLGAKTFGKASVQTVIPLKDGSAVRFTIAYYYTPSGKLIKSQGIIPDVVVERKGDKDKKPVSEEVFEKVEAKEDFVKKAPLPKEPVSKKPVKAEDAKKDNQLEEAVKVIKTDKIPKLLKKK